MQLMTLFWNLHSSIGFCQASGPDDNIRLPYADVDVFVLSDPSVHAT